jgi:putative transposase
MTRLEDRQTLLHAIEEARAGGARLAPACALAGIDPRTAQRWQADDGLACGDRRPDADRPTPSHALTAAERARIIEVANEPRFAETPPARIVPALADEGTYIASEASFHRVLRVARERNPRRWSAQTRNWTLIAAVTLNPERDAVVQAALVQSHSNTRNRGVA